MRPIEGVKPSIMGGGVRQTGRISNLTPKFEALIATKGSMYKFTRAVPAPGDRKVREKQVRLNGVRS